MYPYITVVAKKSLGNLVQMNRRGIDDVCMDSRTYLCGLGSTLQIHISRRDRLIIKGKYFKQLPVKSI